MKFIILSLLLFVNTYSYSQNSEYIEIEGVLTHEWGDSFDPKTNFSVVNYYFTFEDKTVQLDVSEKMKEQGPLEFWSGQRVIIKTKDNIHEKSLVKANLIKLVGDKSGNNVTDVTGAQPWVSIACKFSDISTEPENQQYFQDMYANSPGGLDHYWREVSYNKVNVVGSIAIDWLNLPSTQTTYVSTPGSGTTADLSLLFTDCTNAADSMVDFSDSGNGQSFVGINMMFNASLDCCAWGGNRWATLDGVTKSWRVTWNPPWAFADEAVISHEMGHGFGLPHANNSDQDSSPYDSPWDVMSAATSYAVNDVVYGRLGKHINSYHKDRLGWYELSDKLILTTNVNSDNTIIIDETSLLSTTEYKMAQIILVDGSFYTIETRKKTGNYEANIVDNAVIIHHVVTGRQEPSWVIDEEQPPANFSDNEGVMWKVGETFTDLSNSLSIEVLSETTNGFEIRIIIDDLIFENSFESPL